MTLPQMKLTIGGPLTKRISLAQLFSDRAARSNTMLMIWKIR